MRWISAAGMETVRGIYGAVRDPNWATIQPVFTTYEGDIRDDAFDIRFRAECVREAAGIDVAWEGRSPEPVMALSASSSMASVGRLS